MAAISTSPQFPTSDVASVFEAYPPEVRERLQHMRRLIFETAEATEGVGPLRETLKWGQPSYLTERSKSGTTIRIDQVGADPGRCALYVHCQTSLVATYRAMYADVLTFDGERGIVFDRDRPLPEGALRHCIALALTYHLRKRTDRQRKGGKDAG